MRILESKQRERWGKVETPIVESKVLIALQNSFASLKDVAKQSFDDVKQLPQEGITNNEHGEGE